MRIFISVLLCFAVLISFIGCKKDEATEKQNCSECGAKIIEGTNFCVRCGVSLEVTDKK